MANSNTEESKSRSERNWPHATHVDPFAGKCIHGKTKDENCQENHDVQPPPLKKLSMAYAT